MTKANLFVGAGTEVTLQVMLALSRAVFQRSGDRWPEETYVLAVDSDTRSQNAARNMKLPKANVRYTHLSVHQLREVLSRNPEAFRDVWREEWRPLLKHAPDGGASALPALGRLMLRAAQDTVVHQLEEFRRQMNVTDDGPPNIFFVVNPLSGTSRGSVYDIPTLLRAVWPGAMIHAVVVFPVGVERMDDARTHLYSTNFIEALKILDAHAEHRTYDVYLDTQRGWESREGQLVDSVLCFDALYGNQRLKQLAVREFELVGGVSELMARVSSFLTHIALRDPLTEGVLNHLSQVALHRSRLQVQGHRAHCHAVHEARMAVHPETFRKALIERGVERILKEFQKPVEDDASQEVPFI